MYTESELFRLFDKWIKKLRITPAWDVRLELVDNPEWRKTGDFKIDCDDRKAILMLNYANPTQENLEEVIVHELMHLKMYPLDQVTESLILATFEEDSPAQRFAYNQFFPALERTETSFPPKLETIDHTSLLKRVALFALKKPFMLPLTST